jgi:outer membrane receptor protein involved in Fe transport
VEHAQIGLAQGITGTITGLVSDPSGAPISKANVSVKQLENNAVRTMITSDLGTYTFSQLAPGHYVVTVESEGFTTFRQDNIVLAIGQVAEINAALQVGAAKDTVTVTAAPPTIQTEDSSIGQVIDSEAIQNTPLNGRLSVMGLISLAPGVQGVGAQDQLGVRGITMASGTGSRNSYGGLGSSLDGVTNQEVTLQRAEPEVPSLDALAEFKVLTNGSAAEFGQPSQVIVATASGTNKFHGEVLEYNRSKGTSAKQYFAGSKPRPAYERNEFGGNFSGPIFVPHLYDGKDRSFFFAAYEGFHLDQSATVSSQQPTSLERKGIFTEVSKPIIDPATGLAFANQTIPTSRLNPVSQQLLNLLYPNPTASGTGVNTVELVPYTSTANRFSLRLDHRINDKNQIRFTFLRALYGPNPDVGSSSLQGGMSQDGERNTNSIFGWTHTFSPTLLLDSSASFFHLPIYRTPQNYKTNFASIIPGLSPQLINGAPQISISNITSVAETGSKDLEQVAQGNTALTKVLAKHTIKTGFSYIYDNHWNDQATTPQRGSYAFNGQYTGTALADFMLGLPSSTSQGTPGNFLTRNISSQWAAYVQDDWKVRPNLTVNVGVRYDLQWFSPGPYNQASLFVPSLGKVVVFGDAYPKSAISSYVNSLSAQNLITLSSAAGLPNNPFSFLGRPNKNIAPRLGFAYQVRPNTVVRGAAGIYYNLLPASYAGMMFGNLPFVAVQNFTNSTSYASAFTMNNPFSATGKYSANPSVNAEHSLVTPYTEEYNLAVEHQFTRSLDLRVGYAGQHNLKQNNSTGSAGAATPNINLADPPVLTATSQSTNKYQPFGAINQYMTPLFHSTMNSLQVGLHKQYSQGIALGAEYQWTRILGVESLEDPSGANPRDSYGPVGGVTPQVLQFNYSYQLPMGQGHLLFANSGQLVNKVVKGWQLSGSTDMQTGQPFSVTYTASPTKADPGLVSGRANRVAGVALYPVHKSRTQWFNPAAFAAPTGVDANGKVVNGGSYGTSGYNMLRGPHYQSWDMSLQKNTTFLEHYNVQLRADAFNIFNHPNFAVPNAAISNTSTVGSITSTSGTPSYQARTMEFAVKFSF